MFQSDLTDSLCSVFLQKLTQSTLHTVTLKILYRCLLHFFLEKAAVFSCTHFTVCCHLRQSNFFPVMLMQKA